AEPEAEEDFAWQGLAGDTQDAARPETTPQQPSKPAARPMEKGEQKAVAREKGVNLLVIGLMVLAGFLVVMVGGAIWGGYALYTYLNAPAGDASGRAALVVSSQNAGKQGV